jgi:hypothetical protein
MNKLTCVLLAILAYGLVVVSDYFLLSHKLVSNAFALCVLFSLSFLTFVLAIVSLASNRK